MRALVLLTLLIGCGREYGEPCDQTAQCADDMTCLLLGAAGYHCVYMCTAEDQFTCPAGYECYGTRDLSPKACSKICESNADCPSNWTCNSIGYCTPAD